MVVGGGVCMLLVISKVVSSVSACWVIVWLSLSFGFDPKLDPTGKVEKSGVASRC